MIAVGADDRTDLRQCPEKIKGIIKNSLFFSHQHIPADKNQVWFLRADTLKQRLIPLSVCPVVQVAQEQELHISGNPSQLL